MNHSKAFLDLVNRAKRKIGEITTGEVYRRLQKGDRFELLDVREDNEWDRGHIAGAKHLGKGIIERDIEKIVPDKNAEIILYCGGGFRSALSADNLQQMGYKKVLSMKGGWRRWNALGYPINGKRPEKH
jgi:rhodanese-related sulfurtransferase